MNYEDYIQTPDGFRQRDLNVSVVYDAEYVRSRYEAIDGNVRALSARRLKVLEAFVPRGKLLDFGAGTFRFVEAALESDWIAFGYDLAPSAHCRSRPTPSSPIGWDVVTFFDSLEHLPDPAQVIRDLNANVVMVSVPWCHYPDYPAWFMDFYHRRPGEHLWFWNRERLIAFMKRLGYRCLMTSAFEDELRPGHHGDLENILSGIFQKV